MSVARAALATMVVALGACASAPSGAGGVQVFNAELRAALDDVAAAMAAERSPLQLPSGTTVTTCDGYLQQSGGIDREDPELMAALQDYVICDSLALLQRARPVPLAPTSAGHALATRLDFRSFPSSRGPRVTAQAYTFETLVDEPLAIDANAATLDAADWFMRVERVAAADFDGDGREDWLLWIGDDSAAGSYRSFDAVVIRDAARAGLLTAFPLR
ncbi:hypothetical protein [Novilysobacter arseniciresistens]|uniref:hypothetical protein n=1 Tax=Novilysobacter arseniciresistens TaxID=1385522 RepID=UPI000A75881E|nr:hypothetical protein [Lysobacter arseniciresistens]